MEVVAQEEVIITAAAATSKDQTALVVKGKRTKRMRPQSPIPFSVPAAQSPSPSPSPATSAENGTVSAEEEEEDMANCLILLAQGRPPATPSPTPPPPPPPKQQQPSLQPDQDNVGGAHKFNSRRFLPAEPAGNNKYVYECKTCNRTFPSFQALGGHRASHKKPPKSANVSDIIAVNTAANNKKTSPNGIFGFTNSAEEDHHHFKPGVIRPISSTALSLQLATRNNSNNTLYGISTTTTTNNNSNKSSSSNKVHECSVCGAEFTSGQALGGHMRRHRTAPPASSTALSLSSNAVIAATPLSMALEPEPEREDRDHQPRKRARSVLCLDLDLNLPAPEDDQHRDSKFGGGFVSSKQQQQQQQQQQSSLVFSAPALVDCHY